MAAKPMILLQTPHTDVADNVVEQCCMWRLTTAIGSVETGEVGFVPESHFLREDVVEKLKLMAVADVNSLQADYVFDVSDCVAWEL